MLKADKANRKVTRHVQERSAKMTAGILRHLDEGEKVTEVRVESDTAGRPANIVCFHKDKNDVEISCFKEETETSPMRNCGANAHSRWCSHVEAAVTLLLLKDEN